MTPTKSTKSTAKSPVEVWLTQRNMEIVGRMVFEDESTEDVEVGSMSMRGAQREITGWLIEQGYTPIGRWENEFADETAIETVRRFKLG